MRLSFRGARPTSLGVQDGRFANVNWRPNHVSSQAPPTDKLHYVRAIEIDAADDPLDVWERLVAAAKALPRATLAKETQNYLHLEVASKGFGFVDDLEIYLPPPMACIHICSAARLGIRDFGVNRARVEALRIAISK